MHGDHVVVFCTMIGDDGQAIAGGESILSQIPLAVWASLVSDELVVEFRRNGRGKSIAAAMRPFSSPRSDAESHHNSSLPQSIRAMRGRWYDSEQIQRVTELPYALDFLG